MSHILLTKLTETYKDADLRRYTETAISEIENVKAT